MVVVLKHQTIQIVPILTPLGRQPEGDTTNNIYSDLLQSGLYPVARLAGMNFRYDARIPNEYQTAAGAWIVFTGANPGKVHPRDYRGATLDARSGIIANNTRWGNWQGPWQ
jgi:hypothetical protein